MSTLLKDVWSRTGISTDLPEYEPDITSYLRDALADMKDSGVPESYVPADIDINAEEVDDRVITAATFYVKAQIETDLPDTEKYLDLYRKKVFRLTLLEDDDGA